MKNKTVDFVEPNNLSELIQQIAKRPASFTGNHDFSRVGSFIEGYVYARDPKGESSERKTLREFSVWLGEEFDKPRNVAWSYTIEQLYDNDAALENLPKLFNRFMSNIKD